MTRQQGPFRSSPSESAYDAKENPQLQSVEEIAAALNDLVQRLGLSPKESGEKRLMLRSGRPARKPKTTSVTMRIVISDWNKFREFCESNNYTVAEGFAQLTKGLPQNLGSESE